MSTNPYAAPRAAVADEAVKLGEYVPGGKGVPAARGWSWIADGWALFKLAPGAWIGIIVIFAVIFFVLALIPFLGSLATMLLAPVFGAGVMLGCRALEQSGRLDVGCLFEGFKTSFGTLLAVGALYLAGWVAVALITMVFTGASVFALLASGGVGQDPAATGAAALSILLAVLIMMALSIPVVMAIWFAPSLVVFHNLGAVEAMKASFTGCLRNVVPFLVYSIAGFFLAILASIPLGLGWLVLGPVFGASIYTAYKDIYLA